MICASPAVVALYLDNASDNGSNDASPHGTQVYFVTPMTKR